MYFNCHNHTMYSNLRLLDCINEPKALIDKAIELGLTGIAITDHECLSAHMEVNQYAKKLLDKHPDFTIALGNEIYLTDNRESGQKYYHFILIAKDELGHKALRELSTIAWYNSYIDRRMERVPVTKDELAEIVLKYKGHLIATTACIGGELGTNILRMIDCDRVNDMNNRMVYHNNIVEFIQYCQNLFDDDFYIECAPASSKDQIDVNMMALKIATIFNIKVVPGTDSHYLTSKERPIHKAYLNSKDGEREVDDFYEFSHLMNSEEATELLKHSYDINTIQDIFANSEELRNKITFYSLERKQIIPKVEVKDYPKTLSYFGINNDCRDELDSNWITIKDLLLSDDIQERYWINECLNGLIEKDLWNEEYISRIEIEADILRFISGKLEDSLFAYFNTFKHYIDLFWDCGSIVGPGRGSATGFLSNYLLGITQLDPIRWKLPYWRFLNKERAELPDIDIDLAPSKRPSIFQSIREERGEFGLVQVATFGTEGTKSAILTACRGYQSEEYPEGIDVEQAQYMSSLVPQERGFLWDIKDVVYGNQEKDRKPVHTFIREVNKYPGLLDIIMYIAGLVNKRSSHASGVILYGNDPFETAGFMRTPSGDLITCYDLHKAEAAGDTKYDFLVTEVSDKIIKCIELLEEDGEIEEDSLRNIYNKYLHPEVIDTEDKRIWQHLSAGDVLDVFQFSGGVGLAIAKKLRPQDPLEMTAANAMMRLMSERGKESQQDRYYRIQKQGIHVFHQEMVKNNLPEEMIIKMHKHCDKYFGCCPIQEQMMEILMDVAGFTLGEANSARKIVAKKQMDKIPQLKEQVYSRFDNQHTADYFWEIAVAPQLGYAFSLNHSLPYSFVGIQTILLAFKYNPIYWNCACLIVNSGALEDNSETEIVDIYEPEGQELTEGTVFIDLPDKKSKIKKTASTDYGKIAKAIGDIRAAGIKVSLANINKSKFGFAPDVENNQILFGLKGLLNVGDELVQKTIENRPYSSIKDYLLRVKPSKSSMISLIKSGAFDEMEPDRKFAMAWYIWETCDKKSNLTLQNMPSLIRYNLIPMETDEDRLNYRVYEFNRYLKAVTKADPCKYKEMYSLDERAIAFLNEIDCDNMIETDNLAWFIKTKKWDKVYQSYMDNYRAWIAGNKQNILDNLNATIFKLDWDKYAKNGNISAWEMEALCFYYHDHELKNVNRYKYGFADFFKLPEDPVTESSFVRAGKEINILKLDKIYGTCIAKNKNKSTVTLLTPTGVVEIKFRKEYFTMFDKRISERGEDGAKHIVEKSWFDRGSMIVVMGFRSGDTFIVKKYAKDAGHQLYKIDEVMNDGDVVLRHNRYKGEEEEDG